MALKLMRVSHKTFHLCETSHTSVLARFYMYDQFIYVGPVRSQDTHRRVGDIDPAEMMYVLLYILGKLA